MSSRNSYGGTVDPDLSALRTIVWYMSFASWTCFTRLGPPGARSEVSMDDNKRRSRRGQSAVQISKTSNTAYHGRTRYGRGKQLGLTWMAKRTNTVPPSSPVAPSQPTSGKSGGLRHPLPTLRSLLIVFAAAGVFLETRHQSRYAAVHPRTSRCRSETLALAEGVVGNDGAKIALQWVCEFPPKATCAGPPA